MVLFRSFQILGTIDQIKKLRAPGNRTSLEIMNKKILILTLFFYSLSCANPTIVNVIGPNDNKLSCKELSAEIAKANQYADEAKEAKKMDKPHNIGAILFFLPGYGVTLKNIDEALIAAKKRAEHLNNLKEKKNC